MMAMAQKAAAIMEEPGFHSMIERHQVSYLLERMQAAVPRDRRRKLGALTVLSPDMGDWMRGAWRKAGRPALSQTIMNFVREGKVHEVPDAPPPAEVVGDLFVQPKVEHPARPSAEAQAADEPQPEKPKGPAALRPVLLSALQEALSKAPKPAEPEKVDYDRIGRMVDAAARKAILEQEPRERWVVQETPAEIDIRAAAVKHLSLMDLFLCLLEKLSQDKGVAGAVAHALYADPPTDANKGKVIKSELTNCRGKVPIRVANPRGTQFADIQRGLDTAGYGDLVELTESEGATTRFCVWFKQGTNHPAYNREHEARETANLVPVTGTTKAVEAIIQFLEGNMV